MMHKVEEPIY